MLSNIIRNDHRLHYANVKEEGAMCRRDSHETTEKEQVRSVFGSVYLHARTRRQLFRPLNLQWH